MPVLVTVPKDTECLIFTDEEILYLRTILGENNSTKVKERIGERKFLLLGRIFHTLEMNAQIYEQINDYVNQRGLSLETFSPRR